MNNNSELEKAHIHAGQSEGFLSVKRNRIALSAALTAISYLIFCVTGRLCTFTDNLMISVVTGGMYGDNNFCQYLHPLLCLVIKPLNTLIPSADVFMFLTHIFLLAGVSFLCYMILSHFSQNSIKQWRLEDYIAAVLGILSILWFVWGQNLFDANYTVQTAALIFIGLLGLFIAKEESRSSRWIIMGTILVGLGFLYRLAGALLFLPFIGLEVLTELIRSRNLKVEIRCAVKYILPALILIIIILLSKWAFVSQEPYATDSKYTSYRTTAVDYPMAYWGEKDIDTEHLHVKETTYENATNWSFLDTDYITVDSLERIAKAGNRNRHEYTMNGLRQVLHNMWFNSAKADIHLTVLVILVVLLTLWNMVTAKDRWLKLETVCAFAGGFIILLYFTFRGRALLRVWQCVLMAMLCILVIITLKAVRDRNRNQESAGTAKKARFQIVFSLLLCVIFYFGVGQVMAHSEIHAPITPLTCRINVDDSMYAPTFEDDALYIWPNWYAQIPAEFSKQNKLPTQRVIDHNIAVGDWVYGQEYFRQFLKRIHAENPAKALLERPNTYLIEGQNELILDFMREHYGQDIIMVKAGKVNGKQAYQFKRKQ